ncbi:MAG TPA: SelB C-terminal domain-containing protein, partial [Ktedonobacterales bacterium]
AINLAGVAKTDLARGDVVTLPGRLRPTTLLDARFELLRGAPRPLEHNSEVDCFIGAKEVRARVLLLDSDELQPGQHGWVQLKLAEPVAVARRDRFILRIPSPSLTIGGGEIIDTQPRHHKRHQPTVLAALEVLERGAPEEVLFAALNTSQSVSARKEGSKSGGAPHTTRGLQGYEEEEAIRRSALPQAEARTALSMLLEQGQAIRIGPYYFASPVWERLRETATAIVAEHHRQYPLRAGLPKEEWRARLGLAPRQANEALAALVAAGTLAEAASASAVRLPGHEPHFTSDQQRKVDALLHQMQANPFSPPGRPEIEAALGVEVTTALIEQGTLIKVSDGVLLKRDAYDEASRRVMDYLRAHETITVAEARDLLGTSRKYMLALLEHLDERRVTRRVGDDRVLGPAAG